MPYRHGRPSGTNILASNPSGKEPDGRPILVSAHYDTVRGSPGADDNASRVAALLECARALHQRSLLAGSSSSASTRRRNRPEAEHCWEAPLSSGRQAARVPMRGCITWRWLATPPAPAARVTLQGSGSYCRGFSRGLESGSSAATLWPPCLWEQGSSSAGGTPTRPAAGCPLWRSCPSKCATGCLF